MELKLNISDADFGAELKQIIDSLTLEEKKEIAKEVMVKCLNEITDCQRTLMEKEKQVFEQIKNQMSSYDTDKSKTPEQLRTHYKYAALMLEVKSPKEEAIKEILFAATSSFKEQAKNLIDTDEKLKQLWDVTSEEIKKDFPKFIHDAMMYWFSSHLGNMQMGIQNSLMQAQNAAFSLKTIESRMVNH